ncbi:hypothetical protein NUU61_010038 [Penicillium alfredii]|uniref:Uncharacterized protein n=1 Tax=Penicillium alfredii TaxID=1506179 RepID=A0A9W9EHB5_9EURO|nr:uncharacterized protein NUU61_010038 [Penicillium alfredii]KAJ5081774.1 hypothetical protein NUU61_010038 [Penicillium alfredii]
MASFEPSRSAVVSGWFSVRYTYWVVLGTSGNRGDWRQPTYFTIAPNAGSDDRADPKPCGGKSSHHSLQLADPIQVIMIQGKTPQYTPYRARYKLHEGLH